MATTYDEASLVLIPSGTKTSKIFSQKPVNGDGDFTFSRSTAATRVNADGNIEKETQNLLLQSNDFDTTWTNSNTTETGGQADKDGGTDAWKITKSASGAYIRQNVSGSGVFAFSVYAKASTDSGDSDGIYMLINGNPDAWATFDLNNGTTSLGGGASVDSNIEDIGSGWYRCSLIGRGGVTDVRIYPTAEDGTYTATSGAVFIQDAQLEQGLVARDYIETTTAAVEGGITDNVPRLDYTDASCPALLLEPQRTNSIQNSEYFGSNWTLGGIGAIDTNSTDSPEGIQNATKFKADSTASTHSQIENVGGGQKTFSIFAKEGEESEMLIYGRTAAVGEGVLFDLSDGSFIKYWNDNSDHIDSYSSTDYGNGWYRYEINFDTATNIRLFIAKNSQITFSQTSGNGIYIYGAQFEDASYATSYIPTYGSAVTRNQDGTGDNKYGDAVDTWAIMYEFDFDKMALQSNIVFSNISSHSSSNTNISFRIFTKSNTHHCIAPYFNVDSEYPFSTNTDNNKVDKNVLLRANGDGSFDYFTNFNDTITKQSVTGNTAIEWGKMNLKGNPQTAYKRIVLVKQALTDEQCESLMG